MIPLGVLTYNSAPRGFEIEVVVSSTDTTFQLPLKATRTEGVLNYDCYVDWGDSSPITHVTVWNGANTKHIYAASGTYQIKITGVMEGWSFNNGGDCLKMRKVIYWGNAGVFHGFKYLANGFFGCTNLTSLGSGKIPASGTGVLSQGFSNTFRNIAITSIPSGLFDNHTNVTTFAFVETFAGCTSLTTIPTDLFKYATLASTSAFFCTFYGCSSLTNIPNGIFNYNTLVDGNAFDGTFKYCSSVTSIPTSLFQYNTLVTSFYDTFASSGVVHVPYQLFDYNTLVTSFYDTFRNCADLLTVPSGLFEHNTLATNFDSTFRDCVNFQLNANMFSSAAGWESTRFKNQSPNFSNCFSRAAFTGARGDAPDLWTCDYGTGTPITTGCFGDLGNSLVSLSNYASIPSGWK